MKKLIFLSLIFFSVFTVFGQGKVTEKETASISGSVEWDNLRINAVVSLNLAQAGIKLPSGRTQGESLLNSSYFGLIQPCLLELQADSSSTIADLIDRGEISLEQAEAIARSANLVAPALSPDLKNITTSVTIPISNISAALPRHSRATPVSRTLNPITSARYTGIIIIAVDELPIHGMKKTAMPVPCIFPKIWDSDMNLIYERYMLEPQLQERGVTMVRYSAARNIYQNNPSGLTDGLREIVGDKPLRIFARGVFGIKPTDLIIERSDALTIISSEENRRLLSQGRVVFILDESVLRRQFGE